MTQLANVLDMSREELRARMSALKLPAYRADQIRKWIFEKGVYDFAKMTDLPQALRAELEKSFEIRMPEKVAVEKSGDGSFKILLKLSSGDLVETVYMSATKHRRIRPQGSDDALWTDSPSPCGEVQDARRTVCVSSQVGCKFHCAFCASGLNGFFRNLTAGEILSQVLYARDLAPDKKITNIVFMGIGEPFDNYDALLKTIRTLNAKDGLALGARKITVSTCGLVKKIDEFSGEGLQIELSVSLHGATDRVRGAIMPVNKAHPVGPLIEACRRYAKKTKRAITFEYILISGVNASDPDARELAKLLKGLLCKVNLIPYNPIAEFPHARPEYPDIVRFQQILQDAGVRTTVRFSKGADIQAACGQLRSVHVKG